MCVGEGGPAGFDTINLYECQRPSHKDKEVVQSPKKVFVCGLVNFVPAVAYLFGLNLPAALSQPGNGLIEIPCTLAKCYENMSQSNI